MIKIRRSGERGQADRGWLQARFTFSFADYHDPDNMGFRVLRVINEDRIAPGKGFGPHAHRDMEIMTYVMDGKLRHRDSMGEHHAIGPNEMQLMSAGSGVVHSEFNASESDPVHLCQIWILPAAEDLEPSYQQVGFAPSDKQGRLCLLAAPVDSRERALTTIRQNVRIYVAALGINEQVHHSLDQGRHGWIQVTNGHVEVNGQTLDQGDGAAVSDEPELAIIGMRAGGEILLFDLP
jgi:redox-sensitive bicupin YhaK (pirin superfamily)